MNINHGKNGFTLIEVLIGVVIISAMSLMIHSIMSRTLDAKQRVERRDEILKSVQIGFDKMAADFSQAFLANATFKGADSLYETGMKGSSDKVDFSTLNHYHYVENAKDTDQVTVGYFLKTKKGGLYDLYRRESNRLGDKIDEGGYSFPLVENVRELKLGYYDSSKEEWVEEWDTSQISVLGRLPEAVKIELNVARVEDGELDEVVREHFFSTIVPVNLYKNEINF